MKIQEETSLASLTSLGVGGNAEKLIIVESAEELIKSLRENNQYTLLGYGCNSLISDSGITGVTISPRGGNITFEDNVVVADSGVWWDDLVMESIDNGLWGLELTSEVPGSVGAATYINITAYGQALSDSVIWVEAWDKVLNKVIKLAGDQLNWCYKSSFFQAEGERYVVIRTAFQLSYTPTHELTYQKALDVAQEMNLDISLLSDRRRIIVEARIRAGSIWRKDDENAERTAGSFFRNPIVGPELAEKIISFDESGKTAEQIKNMNKVHGGSEVRVSAAHVMLASGFTRGKTWNKVKLNDKNVLKIETLPGATAQEVYDVMKEIQKTCQEKVGVNLEPEVQIIGDFS